MKIRFGTPLYLQFKRAYYMKTANAAKWGLFNSPYYKMNLMRSKYSPQQELLIHLELSGKEVFYIAPEFYTNDELAINYTNKNVFNFSALFRPSDIGHLPDDAQHYIAFDHGVDAYMCSDEIRTVKKAFLGETFREYSSTYLNKSKTINKPFFDDIINNMIDVYENYTKTDSEPYYNQLFNENKINTLSLRQALNMQKESETIDDAAQTAAYLSRAFYDSELIIVGERGDL